MKKVLSILLCFITILLGIKNINSQSLHFNAKYTGDLLYNTGGFSDGGGYLGYAKIGMVADLWKGASLYVGGGTTHGITPSEMFIGDYQIANNIEAGNHAFMELLSLQQYFGKFSIKVGLQDMNENFASLDAAGEYLNSSFGIHPVFSTNMSVAIFPLTGLGTELHFNINDNWHIQAAVYDGEIHSFEDNPYNLNWELSKDEGLLFIGEGQYIRDKGVYKFGSFYHTAEKKYGFYVNAEQEVWNKGARILKPFVQIGYAHGETQCENHFHLAAGLNLEGVFSKEAFDMAGLAFTSALLSDKKTETAVEFFYQYQITDKLTIKPDIQYIINPAGMESHVDNAFVSTMRILINIE